MCVEVVTKVWDSNAFSYIYSSKILYDSGFSRETEPVRERQIKIRDIERDDCKGLAHLIMKADESHNLPSEARGPEKPQA